MNKIKNRVVKVFWTVILFNFINTPLQAAEWGIDGTVDQSISYDDNVIMRSDPQGSFIYQVTPIVNLYRRTQSSEISANASYGIQHFFDLDFLGTQEHQQYGLNGKYWGERVTWGFDASYAIAPSRDSAEQDAGDFDTDSQRKNFRVSPSVSYKLSAQDRLTLSASYTDTRYGSITQNDNDQKQVNLTWAHDWSERLRSSIHVFYSKYDSSGHLLCRETIPECLGNSLVRVPRSIDSDSWGLNLTTSYMLSEKWNLFVTVGGRMTETETAFLGGIREDSSEGFLVNTGFDYSSENLMAELKLSRSLVPSSQGGLNEQSRFSLDVNYFITERLSSAIFLSYQETETDHTFSFIGEDKRKNVVVRPSVSWQLDQDWRLSASYRFRYRERPRGFGKEDAYSNLIMFSVNYNWPGLSIAR